MLLSGAEVLNFKKWNGCLMKVGEVDEQHFVLKF